MPKYDHLIYNLDDSGSFYEAQGVVLYPGVPISAETLNPSFVARLLEEKIVLKCAVDKDESGSITGYSLMKKDKAEESTAPLQETPGGIVTIVTPVIDITDAQDIPADKGETAPSSTARK